MISSMSAGMPFFSASNERPRAGKGYPKEAQGGVLLGGTDDDISTPKGAQEAVARAIERANEKRRG